MSQNFKVDGSLEKSVKVEAPPYCRVLVARLVPIDTTRRAVLKVQYRWALSDVVVPRDLVRQDIAARDSYVEKQLSKVKALRLGELSKESAYIVQERCLEYGVLYVDCSFPPLSARLPPASRTNGAVLTWKRPDEFMIGPHTLLCSTIEPGDIRPGSLADCWLQCALASLAEFPDLVENLFVDFPCKTRAGVYCVRLCRNGNWQKYVLDDYFPCFADGGGPVYSRNHGNELWVMLIEKAFAKSFDSFASMEFGWSYEAMIDLTGCPFKTIRLQDEEVMEDIASGLLWRTLLEHSEVGYLLSATTPGEDIYSEERIKAVDFIGTAGRSQGANGLVAGHTYTILTVIETINGEHQLLKLRNPWGSFEWQGDWSDSSTLWTPALREELGAQAVVEDGTFWMSMDDICKYFFSVNVSIVAQWEEIRRRTYFIFPKAIGGLDRFMMPPMYVLSVPQTRKVFVSIHQEDTRGSNVPPYVDIAITVLRLLPDYTFDLVASSGSCVERQVQVEMTLTEGNYMIVCCSSGCKYSQYSTEVGNIYFDSDSATVESPLELNLDSRPRLLDDKSSSLTPQAQDAFREIFNRLDEDMDGILNFAELHRYLQMTESCTLEKYVFSSILRQFDSKDNGLTLQGFLQAQLYICLSAGGDEAILLNDLLFMGYSKDLKLTRARPIVLAIHSNGAVGLRTEPFDKAAYDEALELPVRRLGVCKEYEDGLIKLYTYKCGYTGVCIAVENCSTSQPLSFDIDATQSRNVVSSRSSLVTTDVIPNSCFRILHYLMMRDPIDWSWTFEASYRWLLI